MADWEGIQAAVLTLRDHLLGRGQLQILGVGVASALLYKPWGPGEVTISRMGKKTAKTPTDREPEASQSDPSLQPAIQGIGTQVYEV